ncbi:hypothetical protein GCM10027321_04160 [Massilia terrae]|uniref:Sel1 repeat family protein n=1 Tax=Massilia terrae TaxID=1811224 RepID=A0ABT2CTC9_9BURK|nr:tetratricopeptide repeat protein [Massilia terrae]MCS0657221.1 sel1 repeat family protein [Massilia terrae]
MRKKPGFTLRLLAGPALLVLLQTATAQTNPAPPSGTVVVRGQRDPTGSAGMVDAAKSKVLSHHYASSCGFMGTPSAAEEDVAQAYLRDFGMDDTYSNDIDRFSDVAPYGDVSNMPNPTSLDSLPQVDAVDGNARVYCGMADRRFAAGQNAILRKDKSLALAFEAFDNKDYARAFTLFNTAWSKIGYDEAGLMLAKMNLYGMGTAKDPQRAIKWLKEVADGRFDPTRERMPYNPRQPFAMNDKIEAAFMLARIYEHGVGTAKDPKEAAHYYERAADFGFVPALNMLGQGWQNGYLGARNPSKALGYYKDAGEKGYVPALYNAGKLYYNGDDGVPRDLKMAGAYFAAAAKAGHPGAMFAAGRMYDLGEGVPTDEKKATVYYKDAALRGNRDAQFALATYFYTGEGVPKDQATARKLFDAAARQGQPDAMMSLGAMEANGEGGPRDRVGAYVWLSLASASGIATAKDALKSVGPTLTAQEKAKAEAILKPTAK